MKCEEKSIRNFTFQGMAECADACHSPSFLKKITEMPMRTLNLPSSFVRIHGDLLSSSVILEGPSRKHWKVGVDGAPEGLRASFGEGFESFVADHVLQLGDQLCFILPVRSHFQVKIYDESGCQKTSALDATGSHATPSLFSRRPSELQTPPEVAHSASQTPTSTIPALRLAEIKRHSDPTEAAKHLILYARENAEKELSDLHFQKHSALRGSLRVPTSDPPTGYGDAWISNNRYTNGRSISSRDSLLKDNPRGPNNPTNNVDLARNSLRIPYVPSSDFLSNGDAWVRKSKDTNNRSISPLHDGLLGSTTPNMLDTDFLDQGYSSSTLKEILFKNNPTDPYISIAKPTNSKDSLVPKKEDTDDRSILLKENIMRHNLEDPYIPIGNSDDANSSMPQIKDTNTISTSPRGSRRIPNVPSSDPTGNGDAWVLKKKPTDDRTPSQLFSNPNDTRGSANEIHRSDPDFDPDLSGCFVDIEKVRATPDFQDTEPLSPEDLRPCWE